ncbi:hypothetical protein [Microbulbifer sp. SAOS-129_SWC]|uniref:hypothetical protein n=1 Tax=Microbulbifer sp. SAOS-129_SWC TaxID=3145235 RepID=UPI0032167435
MLRLLITLLALALPLSALADTYDLLYRARLQPDSGTARVEIQLSGDKLPRKLTLDLSSGRYADLHSDQKLEHNGEKVTWFPKGPEASLSYQFTIDEKKGSGHYDSRITKDWAILRSDKLIPPMSVVANRHIHSRAELVLDLPKGWSSALPYREISDQRYKLVDPGRRFIRPKGWMIAGRIGSRQDEIDGINVTVAAPLGENIHRQDTLAFLSYNLPDLKKVFPNFPRRLLVVSAGDPMWRGGLSGTRSLFMHADRPMISGNRTSSIIHELVHVATGIHGDKHSDWIVEGLAEYYALEITRRSGGIGEKRYKEAMDDLAKWGREAPTLLRKRSSGPITARAVGVMREVDREIRQSSGGKASLDDVARALAEDRGEVSLAKFRHLAEQAAGGPVPALQLERLSKPEK